MNIRLVDAGWDRELKLALQADSSSLRIVSPFIKFGALSRLLALAPSQIQVITRFNLSDFAEGVSDLAALRRLLNYGGRVRGIRALHAKLYLFGASRAIVTSANLTAAALDRNRESGLVTDDRAVVSSCRSYFDTLWHLGGADLTLEQVAAWEETVTQFWAAGGRPGDQCRLPDYGANAGLPAPSLLPVPISVTDAPQGFVKFLGDNDRRVPLSFETIREIDSAGCHWAVAYPSSKRPRSVQDGAAIFIGRLTHDPVQGNDIRIFGRAIGLRHVPGRDDASPDEIAKRPWKADWPRYVRVHHAQFVAGTMANGVSMNELMDVLMAQSFAPTQRNARIGVGNTNPRKAYLRQAAVELSSEGFGWLADRLQAAFLEHGNVPQYALDALDRPTPLPLQSTPPGA